MNSKPETPRTEPPLPRTWDGRLSRWLVRPLRDTWVTPNHLTTLRLLIGVAGMLCLARGGFAWSNWGALLVVISNFVDHTDGELARISGKSSKFGHFYDLASDAFVTVGLFVSMGLGIAAQAQQGAAASPTFVISPVWLGTIAGVAVALIFFLRMRIESIGGKAATKQSSVVGFETEDVLYLLPLVTLTSVVPSFVLVASIGAPLFAAWVIVDYWRVVRRARPAAATGGI